MNGREYQRNSPALHCIAEAIQNRLPMLLSFFELVRGEHW